MEVQRITNPFFTVYELCLNPNMNPLKTVYDRVHAPKTFVIKKVYERVNHINIPKKGLLDVVLS